MTPGPGRGCKRRRLAPSESVDGVHRGGGGAEVRRHCSVVRRGGGRRCARRHVVPPSIRSRYTRPWSPVRAPLLPPLRLAPYLGGLHLHRLRPLVPHLWPPRRASEPPDTRRGGHGRARRQVALLPLLPMLGRLRVGELARTAPHVRHAGGRRDPSPDLAPRRQLVLARGPRVEAVN